MDIIADFFDCLERKIMKQFFKFRNLQWMDQEHLVTDNVFQFQPQ
jgi:hypothetical protein